MICDLQMRQTHRERASNLANVASLVSTRGWTQAAPALAGSAFYLLVKRVDEQVVDKGLGGWS